MSDSLWSELDQPRRRLLLEILSGLGRQVLEMRGTIDASAEDWGEILPEELGKIKIARQQILQQEQRALDAVASEMDQLEKLVRDGQLKADQLKHLVEERTANIENKTRLEIERIRSEIRPFGLIGTGGSGVYSPSASAGILTRTLGVYSPSVAVTLVGALPESDLPAPSEVSSKGPPIKPGGGIPTTGRRSTEPTDKDQR